MSKIFARINFIYAILVIFFSVLYFIVRATLNNKKHSEFRKGSSKVILNFLGLKVKVVGQEDPNAQMFIMNHQSMIDIMLNEAVTSTNNAWVAKRELFELPIFGPMLRKSHGISIDRENKQGLVGLLKDTKAALDEGRTICIFPEGTRSKNGKILPFKQGSAMVANKNRIKVQPLILVNTGHAYDSRSLTFHKGEVRAVFLDTFIADRSDKEWLANLRKKMQEAYDRELADITSNR